MQVGHLCILKAIKNWTWKEARLNLPLPTVAMTTSLILIGIIRLLYSGWFVQSVYKVGVTNHWTEVDWTGLDWTHKNIRNKLINHRKQN